MNIIKNNLIQHVISSIEKAEKEISKLNNEILHLEGMSSVKVRHLLNNLCSYRNIRYLEIGIFKGATFISALYKNEESILEAIAIDDWSYFDASKNIFLTNTKKFLKSNSFNYFESDCFKLDTFKILNNKINVYFYDGSHTSQSHKLAFSHFNNIFDDIFIAIVDDYNWDHVKISTQEVFKELKYKILFEKYLESFKKNDKNGWWNGIYIVVISK